MEDKAHKNGRQWRLLVEKWVREWERREGAEVGKEKVGRWMVTPILLYPLSISHFLFHFCPDFLAPFCTKFSGLILFHLK
jgi:hypothetical protein